jgi:hypothetical protein
MFSRFRARREAAAPGTTTKKNEETPEVPQEEEESSSSSQSSSSTLSFAKKTHYELRSNQDASPMAEAALEDVRLEVDDHGKQQEEEGPEEPQEDDELKVSPEIPETEEEHVVEESPELVSDVPSAWIHAFDKNQSWAQGLTMPTTLAKSIDTRIQKLPSKNAEVRFTETIARREERLDDIAEERYQYHLKIAHAAMAKLDLEDHLLAKRASKIEERIQDASDRREAILLEKAAWANELTMPMAPENEEDESVIEAVTPQKRFDEAIKKRNELLSEKKRRARMQVDRARFISSALNEAEGEYAEYCNQHLEERLHRADVRRSIFLDRRRLNAGRHANYVRSVYLTGRYMERRTGEMIQHNLDAADFRREVRLEERKSNARQHNLSAQFRVSCANRLFDAKWLNKALKSNANQTTAKMRREMIRDNLLDRLHKAELHRADVRTALKISNEQIEENRAALEQKVAAAQYRRELQILKKTAAIKARRTNLRARKLNREVQERRTLKQKCDEKMNMANKRRELLIERRRAHAASRNWHAKAFAHRHLEEIEEQQALGKSQIEDKLDAASERKDAYQRPIFAELDSLRGVHARQVMDAWQEYKEKSQERKDTFSRMRLAGITQNQLNKSFDRIAHQKEVQSRRERFDTFKKQCISSTMFARMRTAEIRRSLYQDAVRASAEETVRRSDIARQRLRVRQQVDRQELDCKMRQAEALHQEALKEKAGTAAWFSGKVKMAEQRSAEELELKRAMLDEELANAQLRRSVHYTRKLEPSALRAERFMEMQEIRDEVDQIRRLSQEEKELTAEARRQDELTKKIEAARNTSNRVTIARLEKRAEEVVDHAIKTAIMTTSARNAEARRQEKLNSIKNYASSQFSHAKSVASTQKELNQIKAEATFEESKLKQMQTKQRRENLMAQRKLGQSTMGQLQPFSGLQVVGKSIDLNNASHVA